MRTSATWVAIAINAVNAAVQGVFYAADEPAILAIAHVATGPVLAALAAVTLVIGRRAVRLLGGRASMRRLFSAITPTVHERSALMPGDDTVVPADVVMDRGFTVPGTCTEVWPWIVQLGKGRAGWYLPRQVERFLPPRGRGLRHLDARWQVLQVGEVIPDYGRDETFTVLEVDPPHARVYATTRRHLTVAWSITLTPTGTTPAATRVRLRLRIAGVRRKWLVHTGGELIDLITIAGLAAGLEERLQRPLL